MPKRDGTKMDMDHATFKSFDTNGDGVISMEELDKGLKPKTRRKIELLLEGGWVFDKEKWDASVARHNKYDMKVIFAQFDADGDAQARRHQDGHGPRHVQIFRYQRRWCHQHGGARQGPEAQDAPEDRVAPRGRLGLRQGEVGRVGRSPQ